MSLDLFEIAREFDNCFVKAMLVIIKVGLSGATSSGYTEPKTVCEARK